MDDYLGSRALVVDDDPTTRGLLVAVLAGAGFDVTSAADGDDAIENVQFAAFDLITMDIRIPTIDGLDAIRAIRLLDPRVPIVVLTGLFEPAVAEALRALGVDHLLVKPFDARTLLAAVRAAVPLAGNPAAR